jgi:hypothetical protein
MRIFNVEVPKLFVGLVICMISVLLINFGATVVNRVTDEIAIPQFQRLAQTTDIKVESKSNSNLLFGQPHDVTYELTIQGKPVTGRCVSQKFSRPICRIYAPGTGSGVMRAA